MSVLIKLLLPVFAVTKYGATALLARPTVSAGDATADRYVTIFSITPVRATEGIL